MINFEKMMKFHNSYHSEIQQDCFITNRSGGTKYGMFKQALRELFKRYRGLKELYFDLEELDLDLEEIRQDLINLTGLKLKRKDIKKKRRLHQRDLLIKNIQDTEKEFKRFWNQSCSLEEILINENGELTDEKLNQLDKEMWKFKIKEMMYIDLVSQGRLKNTTLEIVNSLEQSERIRLLDCIKNKHKQADLLNEYENYDKKYEIKDYACNVKTLVDNDLKQLED